MKSKLKKNKNIEEQRELANKSRILGEAGYNRPVHSMPIPTYEKKYDRKKNS